MTTQRQRQGQSGQRMRALPPPTETDWAAAERDEWPQSEDAELSLLGSLVMDPDWILRVRSIVRPNDCRSDKHRTLLTAMNEMVDAGVAVDLVTLTEHLRRRHLLDEVGGASYVSSLANQVPTSANADAYAREVANTSTLRRLLAASAKIAALAVQEPSARVALQQAQDILQEVATGALSTQDGPQTYGVLLDELFADILERMQQVTSGIQTGFPSLDGQLGGLEPGELIYLCGRPGSGKSAFGVNLATSIARRFYAEWQERRAGRTDPATGALQPPEPDARPQMVGVFTLEMTRLQVVRRIVASIASVNTRMLRAGFRLPDGSINVAMYHAVKAQAYADKPTLEDTFWVDPRPTTVANLRSTVLTEVARRNLGVVLIDQLDLMSDEPETSRRGLDETARIQRFSRLLKQLATEANVPIICMAQLNRNVEQRQNKRPVLSDLRSSGQLEQDGSIVMGLYRAAYYDAPQARKDQIFAQFAEALILKNREGEANVMAPLRYEGQYTRFSEWPADWDWPADETRGNEG